MDTKLVREFGTEILSYRLRTVRQKKRMQYEDFDKGLIQISKEERHLWQQRRNLGWEPLLPPIQRGWNRFFVLREDVAIGKNAEFWENILSKINTYDWSYRKDFKIKRRKFGRKIYVVKPQSLLRPREWEFQRLGLTDAEKQLFHEVWEFNWKREPEKRYVFNEPWRFVLRIRPNIIDKVKKRDALLEGQLKQIDNYLERNCFRKRLDKLLHGSAKWWYYKGERKWEKYEWKNIPVHQILNHIDEGLQ
ncbi:MAG TPA: hypothetical protein VIM79_00900 [Niastella sp.]